MVILKFCNPECLKLWHLSRIVCFYQGYPLLFSSFLCTSSAFIVLKLSGVPVTSVCDPSMSSDSSDYNYRAWLKQILLNKESLKPLFPWGNIWTTCCFQSLEAADCILRNALQMGLSSAFLGEEFTHAKLPLLMDVYLPRPGHNWLWTETTFPARLVSMPLPLESLFGAALTFTEEHIWKLCYCYSSFPPPTRHEILTRNQATNPRTTLFHVLLMPIIKKYKCQWVVWVLYKINISIRGDKLYQLSKSRRGCTAGTCTRKLWPKSARCSEMPMQESAFILQQGWNTSHAVNCSIIHLSITSYKGTGLS